MVVDIKIRVSVMLTQIILLVILYNKNRENMKPFRIIEIL